MYGQRGEAETRVTATMAPSVAIVAVVLLVILVVVGLCLCCGRARRRRNRPSTVCASSSSVTVCAPVQCGPRGECGPRGYCGPQGDCGPKGPKGNQGDRGHPGCPGDRGVRGDRGPIGQIGNQGPQGPEGVVGNQGNVGNQGPLGFRGPSGVAGQQGPQGNVGAQGIVGFNGATRFWVYSTPGIVTLSPTQRRRFLVSLSFSTWGLARLVDPLTTTFDQFYPDCAWTLPHSVTLRSLTITISGRVGNNPEGETLDPESVIATVPLVVQGLTFGVYSALPEQAEFTLTPLSVHFSSDANEDSVRVAQSGLVNLFFPAGTQLALCMFNGVDLDDAAGLRSNYALDLKMSGSLRYDCFD